MSGNEEAPPDHPDEGGAITPAPTAVPAPFGTGANLTDTLDSASGKSRMVIDVPSYDGVSARSYLRLGARPPMDGDTDPEPGSDLTDNVAPDDNGAVFIDDTRDRSGVTPAPATPPTPPGTYCESGADARLAESARLFSKGGWRDHTDGNRIVTTVGDKLEVIGGNYKLLALGRQTDGDSGAFWEASGGQVQDNDIAPGAISRISWQPNKYDGTWTVVEETEKGAQKTVYHGDVVETFSGNTKTSTVGAETPSDFVVFDGGASTVSKKLNPTVTENTWARSIESYTGSSINPVGSIAEVTWVTASTSSTYGKSITETTVVTAGALPAASGAASAIGDLRPNAPVLAAGAAPVAATLATAITNRSKNRATEAVAVEGQISSRTTAGSIWEKTHTTGDITELVTAKNFQSTVTADKLKETVEGDIKRSRWGLAFESWNGATKNFLEIFLGAYESLRLAGFSTEFTVAPSAEIFLWKSFQLSAGVMTEIHVGTKTSVSCGINQETDGDKITTTLTSKEVFTMILYGGK